MSQNDAGEQTNVDIAQTLEQRGTRYGNFQNHAELSQTLKNLILRHYHDVHGGPNAPRLEPYVAESISMICHKLGRIANGDPMYDDSWRDIAGYAQLVVDILNEPKG